MDKFSGYKGTGSLTLDGYPAAIRTTDYEFVYVEWITGGESRATLKSPEVAAAATDYLAANHNTDYLAARLMTACVRELLAKGIDAKF